MLCSSPFPPLFFTLLVVACAVAVSIVDYGAVPGDPSHEAAEANSNALRHSFLHANSSSTDRTVVVPSGKFFYYNVSLDRVHDIVFRIEGQLVASNNISAEVWKHVEATMEFSNSTNLEITGSGMVDGQGYRWWWEVILTAKDFRPHLLLVDRSSHVLIHSLFFQNSPMFHLLLRDSSHVVVRNVDIHVDVSAQKSLLEKHGYWMTKHPVTGLPLGGLFGGIPTFPLNTDGIDPSGSDYLIENCTIENFDDAVAVKPTNGGDINPCSQDMLIRNVHVKYSVGLTIGSVPPHVQTNCVRNITFEACTMTNAIKGIYVKSNPGDEGSGIIDQISYRNISIHRALWMPIWIGPQQQKQPGTTGTGCSFFYPISKTCPTDPRVRMSRIVLEDLVLDRGLLMPGVVLCDPTTPCTAFRFTNVTNSGPFFLSKHYVCKNAFGLSHTSTPAIPFQA